MGPRRLFAVGVCWALAGVACTTEDSGIRPQGGSAGSPGSVQGSSQDGSPDAPVAQTGDAARCDPALDRALGASCGCAEECASGFCADGVCCNTQCTGACVACNQPGAPGDCSAVKSGAPDPHGVCARQGAETCGYDGSCNGMGACSKHKAGTVCKPPSCSGGGLTPASSCDGNGTCLAGSPINCAPSICAGGACKVTCAGPGDCAVPHVCAGGSCGLRGLGQPCTNTSQCKSGFCADGVCCDSACTGKCMNCGLPSALGRCVPVGLDAPDPRAAAGVTDPALICADQGAGSCGNNGRCDGAGGCQRYGNTTVCKDQTCDPATNLWVAQSLCNNGTCVTPAARSCSPNKCGGNRCGNGCTSSADCTAGNLCINGSCGKKPLGTLCAQDAECFSNLCAQGVCCNGRCNGVCQTCNAAGSQGICISVPPGGEDPTRTCTDEGAAGCGNDGTCNGGGACRRYRAGTKCADATCVGGVVTAVSLCNGTGTCQPGLAKDCPGIMCDPALPQCLSGCTRDSQCIPPNTCQSGKCGQSGPGGPCDDVADCKQTPSPQFCVRGVCCNVSSCSGCKTCGTGTCTDVGVGKPPPGGGCPIDPANPICGNSGTCDGSGRCTVAAAGTSCGNTCQGDSRVASACPGNGALCMAGAPVACNPFTCRTGACVAAPCTANGDCAAGKVCVSGACKTCNPTSHEGCAAGQVCVNDTCKTGPGGSCTMTSECGFGTCVGTPLRCCNCPAPSSCTDAGCTSTGVCNFRPAGSSCPPRVCNGAGDAIVENTCDGAGTCTTTTRTTLCLAPTPRCQGGECVNRAAGETCGSDAECSSGACLGSRCCTAACTTGGTCGATACNGSGACVYPTAVCGGPTCTDGDTRTTTTRCRDGACSDATSTSCNPGFKCSGGVCPTTCSGDGDCLADYTCVGTTCKKRLGESCSADAQCPTDDCINGICCQPGCGKVPGNACGYGCNGSGACTFAPLGTTCGTAVCAAGATTTPRCDAAHVCTPEVESCMSAMCNVTGDACAP